jgi:hypothetical protein
MAERMTFFDPVHGIGLRIDAGSGRSWIDEPHGDPTHAHCRLDVPRDTLLATPDTLPASATAAASAAASATAAAAAAAEPERRPTSGTFLIAWGDLLRFADHLTDLGSTDQEGTARLGDRFTAVSIHVRGDGRLQAETTFTQGHHVTMTLRCQTLWDRHFGVREELPALGDRIRTAVRLLRPPT